MQGDLTTLANVKAWLAPSSGTLSDAVDPMLSRLIASASSFVLGYISRSIVVADYDEWYDSGGQNFLNLRQWPVLSVASVQFASVTIDTEATGVPPLNGWRLIPPTRLMVTNYTFPRGRSCVRVQYEAGYRITGESHVVPEIPDPAAPLTVQTNFTSLLDLGVTLADGTPLVAVTGVPGAGEYSVVDGLYTFNDAQAEETVLITYSYVPADLDQAVVELVGERYRQRDRIGMNSKSLPNGESVSFLVKDMNAYTRRTVDLYRRVI